MPQMKIAVIGANGQVGQALLSALTERDIEIETLLAVGFEKAGESIRFQGKNITVVEIEQVEDWSLYQMAFMVATPEVTARYATQIAESGCLVIDATGYLARDPRIPLICPKLQTIESIEAIDYRESNQIAVVHPLVAQLLQPIAAVTDLHAVRQISVTHLLPASFFGKAVVGELASQSARLLNGLTIDPLTFDQQQAFNLLPNPTHERLDPEQIHAQLQRFTGYDDVMLQSQSVVVPIFYGLMQMVSITTEDPIASTALDPDALRAMDLQMADKITPVTEVNQSHQTDGTIKITQWQENDSGTVAQYVTLTDNVSYLGAQLLLDTAALFWDELRK